MENKSMIPFLVGMMLLTGVCNTLLQKYQDMQCVENCSDPNPKRHISFEQPIWQTVQMFIGESGCWIFVGLGSLMSYVRKRRGDPATAGYEPVNTAEESTTVNETGQITVTPGGGARESAEATALLDGEDSTDANPLTEPLTADQPITPTRRPLAGWRVIVLLIPAACDICATTLMNVGLLFVAASIYQMTRGALVLFVGLFSVIFLGRYLPFVKWLSLFIVVGGVAIVGLAGYLEHKPLANPTLPGSHGLPASNLTSTSSDFSTADSYLMSTAAAAFHIARRALEKDTPLGSIVGVGLTALAQVFTACQFVSEELIVHRYAVTPLSVVGWEGLFGLAISLLILLIGHASYGSTPAGQGGYFDMRAGWHQMVDNPHIATSSVLIMISIGSFNYFGLSVTRSVSATARSTIDTCRTLFIWIVSLGLGWESFKWLQIPGFMALVYGTFLFNEVVRAPWVVGWVKGRLDGWRGKATPE